MNYPSFQNVLCTRIKKNRTALLGHRIYQSKDWTIYAFQYWNESLAHGAELFLESCPAGAHDTGGERVERVSKWLWDHKIYTFKSGDLNSRVGLVQPLWSYRQFSNIRLTQSPNISVSRLVFLLSLPNPLKPRVKLRSKMRMLLRMKRQQAMLQLHMSDQQFYCLLRRVLY